MYQAIRRIISKLNGQVNRLLADKEVFSFCVAFAGLCVCYRVWLFATLFFGNVVPFGFVRGVPSALALSKSLASDLLAGVIVALVCVAANRFFARFKFLWRGKFFVAIQGLLAVAVLLMFSLLMLTHYRLVFEVESGLNLMFLEFGTSQLAAKDIVHMLSGLDGLFLVLPLATFVFSNLFPAFFRRVASGGLVAVGLFSLAALALFWLPPVARELSCNPALFLARDILRAPMQFYFGKRNPYANRADLPGKAQMNSIKLVDDAFVFSEATHGPAARMLPQPPKARPWNVLFFLLESTGADYVFDTSEGKAMPMPFLRSMADEGIEFANHRSACNSSVRAFFSIFSGLYPRPRPQFLLSKTISLPLMNRYLSGYHSFLVHPSSFTYSFPLDLIANNGINEKYCYETLPKGPNPEQVGVARNEIDTVSFLLGKLDTVKEPFVGIYWSFIPHHPYSDYGAAYRIRPTTRSRDRYYNNLRTLDVQLRRVFDHLRSKGLLDRTILVFVGDHGEAFGQHPGVFAHAVGTFSEMFRVPMILYQPRVVEHQVIQHLTSHVDIVPTLLDLMGVSWDENTFQGESAFRESRRKYIFQMDALADYTTVIDTQMNKVSIGFEHGNVYAYNLAKDPDEKIPLAQDRFAPHLEAILKFRNYQNQMLDSYNTSILGGKDFPQRSASRVPEMPAPQ